MRGLWPAALGSVLLGTIGTALTMAPGDLSIGGAAAWRSATGSLGLLLLSRFRHGPAAPLGDAWRKVAVGGVAFAINQFTFFVALDRAGVAVGTVIAVASVQVAAGTFDWLLERRRPAPRWWTGIAVAIGGVAALGMGGAESMPLDPLGVMAAVTAGTAGAAVVTVAQRLIPTRGVVGSMASVMTVGAVLLAPLAVASARSLLDLQAAAVVLWLGLVTITGAYALLAMGLSKLTVATVAGITLIEPAVAAILAVTVVGEQASFAMWLGVTAILVGVGIASIEPRRRTSHGDVQAGIPVR